jgi:N-methylhydantoinase B
VEPAFGLFGGREGRLNRIELQYPDGKTIRTTSKDLVRDVPAGTLYLQHAGGGGGYGPPTDRPAAKVQQEVRDGIISIQVARDLYGVSLDPETLDILEAQTASLRTTER